MEQKMRRIVQALKNFFVGVGKAMIEARMVQVRKEMSLYQWNLRDYTKEIDKNSG
jgi:hypothetical protein